jgi:hypothetical protein
VKHGDETLTSGNSRNFLGDAPGQAVAPAGWDTQALLQKLVDMRFGMFNHFNLGTDPAAFATPALLCAATVRSAAARGKAWLGDVSDFSGWDLHSPLNGAPAWNVPSLGRLSRRTPNAVDLPSRSVWSNDLDFNDAREKDPQ